MSQSPSIYPAMSVPEPRLIPRPKRSAVPSPAPVRLMGPAGMTAELGSPPPFTNPGAVKTVNPRDLFQTPWRAVKRAHVVPVLAQPPLAVHVRFGHRRKGAKPRFAAAEVAVVAAPTSTATPQPIDLNAVTVQHSFCEIDALWFEQEATIEPAIMRRTGPPSQQYSLAIGAVLAAFCLITTLGAVVLMSVR